MQAAFDYDEIDLVPLNDASPILRVAAIFGWLQQHIWFLPPQMKRIFNLDGDRKAVWMVFLFLLFLLGNLSRHHLYFQKNAAHISLVEFFASSSQSDRDNLYSQTEALLHVTDSWRSHGLLLSSVGFHAEAVTSYEKGIAQDPADILVSYLWGMSEVQLANAEAAVQIWQLVDPIQIVDVLSQKVESAINTDDIEQAEKWANYLIEVDPDSFKGQYWAGRSYRSIGRYAQALHALNQAVEISTNDNRLLIDAYRQKGDIHMILSEWPEAVEAFQTALNLAPDNISLRTNLGLALTRAGQFEDAEDELLAAIAANPDFALGYNRLGLLYRQRGDFETATYWYQKSYEVDPTSSRALRDLGIMMFRDERDFSAALGYFQQAVVVEPEVAANWLWLARVYDTLTLSFEMELAYRQAIANSSSMTARIDVLIELADALMSQEQYESALQVFGEVLEIQSTHGYAQQMIEVIESDYVKAADNE